MRAGRTILAVATAAGLAACGPGAERPIGQGRSADPVELVGLWRVHAEAEDDDTWLRLDADEFQLWRGAGFVDGGWDASESTLVATAWGRVGEGGTGDLEPGWLVGTHTYRRTDEGWELLDDDGEPLATMTVDGAPEPIPSAVEELARAPEVTDEVRRGLRPPVPLPEGLTSADADRLAGRRWVPAEGSYDTDPHVVLHEDGSWTGSDGCNAAGGHWAVPDGGRLLSTVGPTTAIGCDGAPVGWWLGGAALAGFDGLTLVLLDREGAELGRLVRG